VIQRRHWNDHKTASPCCKAVLCKQRVRRLNAEIWNLLMLYRTSQSMYLDRYSSVPHTAMIRDSEVTASCLVSSITFPFIRSNRIEFYFFRIRSFRDAYTARKRQRRDGTAVRTRNTETDERKRNAGNQALRSHDAFASLEWRHCHCLYFSCARVMRSKWTVNGSQVVKKTTECARLWKPCWVQIGRHVVSYDLWLAYDCI